MFLRARPIRRKPTGKRSFNEFETKFAILLNSIRSQDADKKTRQRSGANRQTFSKTFEEIRWEDTAGSEKKLCLPKGLLVAVPIQVGNDGANHIVQPHLSSYLQVSKRHMLYIVQILRKKRSF